MPFSYRGFSGTFNLPGLLFFALALCCARSPLSLLAAIFCHEAGHLVCAALTGTGKPRFRLLPAGMRLSFPPARSFFSELLLCLSGPAASLILAALFPHTDFSLYCLGLGLVNLLPLSVFDGGGVLSSLLPLFLPCDTAARVCRAVSAVFAAALVLFNVLIQLKAGFNLTLMAVTLYASVTVFGDGA